MVKTVEKVTKAIIIEPNASFVGKFARRAPIIVLDCLRVAVVASCIVLVE